MDLKKIADKKKDVPSNVLSISEKAEHKSGDLIYYRHKADTSYAPKIGVEIEIARPTSHNDQRECIKVLEDNKLLARPVANMYSINGIVKRVFDDAFYPWFLYRKTYEDSNNSIESPLVPMTMKAHQEFYPVYAKLLDTYKTLKYDASIQGCGIHLTIDESILGENEAEVRENVRKLIWFLFLNKDEMLLLSRRRYSNQSSADMYDFLGDKFNNLAEEQLKKTFVFKKDELLKTLFEESEDNDYDDDDDEDSWFSLRRNIPYTGQVSSKSKIKKNVRYFNIHFNKKSKPCFEWRWFHTTDDPDILLGTIELAFAVLEFCKKTSGEDNLTFSNLIDDLNNSTKYKFVHEFLRSFDELNKYFV